MARPVLFPLGSRRQKVVWWFFWAIGGIPWSVMFRWKPGAHKLIPRKGPFLLVANHASMFDPVWVAFWLFRRVNYLTSSALFRVPILGRILTICGCIPKAKFDKDPEAMKALADRYEDGDIIVLFPEGTRSWDGRPGQTLPGIGRLVKRLNARVVTARVLNGHLYHPRWARFPRWVPIRVDYDPARTFPDSMSVEEIADEISRSITINPKVEPEGLFANFAPGYRKADGLPDYLWACPTCYEEEALTVPKKGGHSLACTACESQWRVDSYNNLIGDSQLRVDEAFDLIAGHFGTPPRRPTGGPRALEDKGLVRLVPRKGPSIAPVEGTLQLCEDGLRVTSENGDLWHRPLTELRAVSVEVANQLTVRTGDELYEVRLHSASPLKWGHFLKLWVASAKN